MHTAQHDGHHLSCARSIAAWMPRAAVEIAGMIGFSQGSVFFADVIKRDDLFPPDCYPLARRQRIERMLSTPMQIDGWLLVLESGERRRMYEKTKRIVMRPGTIGGHAAAMTQPASYRAADAPLPSIAPEVRALSDNGVLARDALPIDVPAIKALVAAEVEARLVMEGVPAAVAYAASEDDVLMRIEEVHRLARERDDKVAVWLNQARQSTGLSDLIFDGEPEPPSEALARVLHVDKWSRERDSRIQAACDELKHAFHRRAS